LLRFARGKTGAELADELDVSPQQVSNWELGQHSPNPENLNKIINTLGLNKLDQDNKAIQYLRSASSKQDLMNLEELRSCKFGELLNYLRILKGVDQKEIGKQLYCVPQTVSKIINNDLSLDTQQVEKLIVLLDLSENSALA